MKEYIFIKLVFCILIIFILNFCSLNKTGLFNHDDLNGDSDSDSDIDFEADSNSDISDIEIIYDINIDKILDTNTIDTRETDILSVCHLCKTDETCCNNQCVNTNTDPQNCGSCGNVCDDDKVCKDGSCSISCGILTECNGICADLFSDNNNCGQCGNVCEQNEICHNSSCKLQCDNLTECNGECVDTSTDRNNCNGCGLICEQNLICKDSSCIPAECVLDCFNSGLFCCSDQNCHECCDDEQCRYGETCYSYFCINIS